MADDKLIYQPLKPFVINQEFGANRACYNTKTKQVITCDGNNPPKGFKSLYGKGGHKGLDLRAFHGQIVSCVQRGLVYKVDANERSGLDVRIESNENGRRFRHIYEHLLGYQHKVGDYIDTGQTVGWADNTGWSSGDHLHFETWEYINGKWVLIDPMTIMYDLYAGDAAKLFTQIKELLAKVLEILTDRLRKAKIES